MTRADVDLEKLNELGFTGVYIIFLILLNNIGDSNEYHNLCFEQKYEKYQGFYLKIFEFLEVKSSIYLNRHVFVMMHYFAVSHVNYSKCDLVFLQFYNKCLMSNKMLCSMTMALSGHLLDRIRRFMTQSA